MTDDEYRELYVFGKIAYREGVPRTKCPHEFGTKDRNAWCAGWDFLANLDARQKGIKAHAC